MRDLGELTAASAILLGQLGDLGLKEGRWPIIGRNLNWERSNWPMPPLVRYEEHTGRIFQVTYDENDPSRRTGEVRVAPGVSEHRPADGLMGSGYVEIALSSLLTGRSER